MSLSFWNMRERVGRKIRPSSLSFTRAAGILLILTLTLSPSLAQVSGTKPPPSPPPSTSTTWAKAYNIPYDYAEAYSVSQLSNGGYLLGGLCDAGAVTNPSCNGRATVMRVASSGNIQSQTQYSFTRYPYFTALGLIRPTSDGGAIFAGNAQFGCPATGQTSCASIVKVDSTGKIQWANDLQFSTSSSYGPLTWPLDLQQTTDGGYAFAGYYFQNKIYNERAWLVKTDSAGKVQWDKIYGADVEYSDRKFLSFQQTSDGGFIAAGFTNQYNDGYNSLWLVKTDSNGNIPNCSDCKTASDASSTVTVKVSNSDIGAVTDGISYLADTLASFAGSFTATKEC